MPIRLRLAFQFTLMVGVLLAAFSVVVYFQYAASRSGEFYSRLDAKASVTAGFVLEGDSISTSQLARLHSEDFVTLFDEEEMLINVRENVVYSLHDQAHHDHISLSPEEIQKVEQRGTINYRKGDLQAVAKYVHGIVVVASAVDRHGLARKKRLRDDLLVANGGALLLIWGLGYLFGWRALRPIASINKQVQEISAEDLSRRLHVGRERDELAQLAQHFNRMLDRIEEGFRMQRSFVSHASHELRTPLTTLRGELEVALLHLHDPKEVKEGLEAALESIDRLVKLTNSLLSLARYQTGNVASSFDPLDLVGEVREAIGRTEQNHPTRSIHLDVKARNAVIMGQHEWLQTVLGNLLDNACKYSPDTTPIKVAIWSEKSTIVLTLRDHGIGIPEEDLTRIFEPLYRSTNAQGAKGFGVGLALTQNITRLMKGHLTLERANPGTQARLIFPLVDEPRVNES